MGSPEYQGKRTAEISRLAEEARRLGVARMLRDDQALTDELTATIIERFRQLLARLGKSEGWAARSLDIKPSTLSQVLSGNYEGDVESRIRKIDKWTETQLARETSAPPAGYAKTSVALQIIGVAKMAQKHSRIAVVHGPSGVGKTKTAQYLAADTPGSIYLRVTTAGARMTAIYHMLATELRIPTGGLTAYQKELAVKEVLSGTGRLVIVDEFHKLCLRGKDEGFHVFRDLHDITECPMLLLGTSDIASYIERGRDHLEAVEQFYGRVLWWLDLTHAASRVDGGPGLHTVDDIRKMLAAHQIRVTSDADQWLTDVANEPRMGGLRAVITICQIAQPKSGGKPITLAALHDIHEERLGPRAAKVVTAQMEQRKRRVG